MTISISKFAVRLLGAAAIVWTCHQGRHPATHTVLLLLILLELMEMNRKRA